LEELVQLQRVEELRALQVKRRIRRKTLRRALRVGSTLRGALQLRMTWGRTHTTLRGALQMRMNWRKTLRGA
jgi:hypothetical protein